MGGLHLLAPGRLELDRLTAWLEDPPLRLELEPAARADIDAAAALVAQAAAGEAPVYGVNTGFGKLARVRIAPADIAELQRRLVLSHMCGVGTPLDDGTVRLVLLLKAGSLALGRSGVRQATIDALLRLLAEDALPVIPGQGSVGASGDLAPLAHVAAALIGVGRVRLRGPRAAGRRGAGRDRPRAARPGRQGGPGAAQRHAGLDRSGDRRPAQGAAPVRRRPDRGCHEHRRGPGQRRAVRPAHPARPQPAGPGRGRGHPGRPARRQRRSAARTSTASGSRTPIRCAASRRSWGRPGTCWPRPPSRWSARPTASPTTRWCSSTRARSSPAATSTPSRWPSPPTGSRWSWPRSATSPSGAWRC